MGTGGARPLKELKDQLAEIRRDRANVKKGTEDAKPPKESLEKGLRRPFGDMMQSKTSKT